MEPAVINGVSVADKEDGSIASQKTTRKKTADRRRALMNTPYYRERRGAVEAQDPAKRPSTLVTGRISEKHFSYPTNAVAVNGTLESVPADDTVAAVYDRQRCPGVEIVGGHRPPLLRVKSSQSFSKDPTT